MHQLISTDRPGLKERVVYMLTASNVLLSRRMNHEWIIQNIRNFKKKKSHTKSQFDYFPKSFNPTTQASDPRLVPPSLPPSLLRRAAGPVVEQAVPWSQPDAVLIGYPDLLGGDVVSSRLRWWNAGMVHRCFPEMCSKNVATILFFLLFFFNVANIHNHAKICYDCFS